MSVIFNPLQLFISILSFRHIFFLFCYLIMAPTGILSKPCTQVDVEESLFVWLHCNGNSIYVFPEKELRGLNPNFHIHMSVSDSQDRSIYFLQQNRKLIIGYVYKSIIDTWSGNRDWGPAISFLGIFVSNFRCCVFAVCTVTTVDMHYYKN